MDSILSDKKMTLSRFSAITLCVLVIAAPAWSQDFRGSITGRVLDASGLGVPGAQVIVTHTGTNVSTATATEQTGDYTVFYLLPGQYRVTVRAKGFKTLERRGIEVRVGDKLALDLPLEVGTASEAVTITAETPLLESTNASSGQVIDSRRISELPLPDGNPFMLTRLAAGVVSTGSFGDRNRPHDNFGVSAIRVEGAPGENEYMLNGFPNMNISRKVGYIPPADAAEQFKIQNSSYDAQSGHTGAAVINVMLKGGTNRLHGTLYEFVRNDALNANGFFRNRTAQPRPTWRYNRYGGSVGGPVIIPKLYDGRDKTFFFFAYEGIPDNLPEVPGNRAFSVPTDAERGGDLSDLCSLNCTAGSIIYDPFTATQPGGPGTPIVRQQMCIRDLSGNCTPGTLNKIDPARISPIAKIYLQFIPRANVYNAGGGQALQSNLFTAAPDRDKFNSQVVRIDHELTGRQKAFFHYIRNRRQEARGGWTTTVNGVSPDGQNFSRNNDGVEYGHVYAFSPTTVLDARVGYSRFLELGLPRSLGAFDPATMGFSAQTVALFNGYKYLPRLTIADYLPDPTHFGGALGLPVGGPTTFNIYSFQPTLTKIAGLHTLRFGYDFRSYRINSSSPGNIAGTYDFNSDFTRAASNSGTQFGQSLASFLLGLPAGGSFIDRNAAGSSYQSLYHAVFFADDWKVSPRLIMNLGVRYEYEAPMTERFNRNIRGFDTTSSNPIEAAAQAAYALKPDVLPPANFHVPGGFLFADSSHRGIWQSGKGNLEPRVGVAYRFGEKTVLRGGWGLFVVPLLSDGTNGGSTFVANQAGYSQATNVVPTNDDGLSLNPNSSCTFNCWANPFPNGAAVPPGSTLGLKTFLGRGIGTFVPQVRRNGLAQHWSVDLERELPGQWLLDVGYFATRGSRLNTNNAIDAIPREFLSTKPIRDDVVNTYLTANVTNPFAGLLPGSNLNNATIARSQLLRPFPEFASISSEFYNGATSYHSAQVRLEKRFSRGYTLNAGYTWSKLIEQLTYLNETDTRPEKRISPEDAPRRFVASGLWELPFGHGRRWGAKWPRVFEEVAGGWQVQGTYTLQSGRPIALGNRVFFGDPSTLRTNISSKTLDNAFPTSGFYFTDARVQTGGAVDPVKQRADSRIVLVNNIRTLPSELSNFRGAALNEWNLSMIKKFLITEQVRLQFRCEALNAFNHPLFDNPNTDPTSGSFGKITGQTNAARYLQLGLKLTF